MVYALDRFEIFVVSIPRTRRVVAAILSVSVLAGLATYGALVWAGTVEQLVALPLIQQDVHAAAVLAAGFAIAALVGGEGISLFVAAYPRRWGQFLALICLGLAAILVPIGFVLDSSAAVWFALGTPFLFAFQTLIVSDGLRRCPLHLVASAVQPAILFGALTVATPLDGALGVHAPYIVVLLGIAAGQVFVSAFAVALLRANVTEVGPFEITAHLVQREELHLDMGNPVSVPVQTFAVETDGDRSNIVAPWVHPGVLEGIGGGRLTERVLATRTERGDNGHVGDESHPGDVGTSGDVAHPGDTFFWHVPSTHLSDSPDPQVYEPVIDAISEPPTMTDQASRLVSRTYDGTTFHGRRYGAKRVVFIESDIHADIEVDVLGDSIDPETTLLVDRHARLESNDREQVRTDAPEADTLRGALQEFIDVLEAEPLHDYRAGDAMDIDLDGISLFALVEAVDGQRTLCLTADQNEEPVTLATVAEEYREAFDEILLFTTDTHASVNDNRFDPQAGHDRVRTIIEAADESVADAAAGLAAERTTVELLGPDYYRLMQSLNILARVYIVSLAGLYVLMAVALWVV